MTPMLLSLPLSPRLRPLLATLSVLALGACAGPSMPTARPAFSQQSLPAAVQVPAGHKVVLETVGVGRISYECRPGQDMAAGFAWAFVGPEAALSDRRGQAAGRYWGPPATWEALDGSQLTGTQLAVAPAGPGAIPLQLVKAKPVAGAGQWQGVSHIQRVATEGGVAPTTACDAGRLGQREWVHYRADYIFWAPAP